MTGLGDEESSWAGSRYTVQGQEVVRKVLILEIPEVTPLCRPVAVGQLDNLAQPVPPSVKWAC